MHRSPFMMTNIVRPPSVGVSGAIYEIVARGWVLALISILTPVLPAQAQTAGQITPKNFLPPPPPGPPGGFTIAESPQLETPAGADKLTIHIGRVEIDGGLPQLQTAHDALVAKRAGITMSQMLPSNRFTP